MYRLNHLLSNSCQIVVRCKAEEGGDAVASSTDDNAAAGGKMVRITKRMIETGHWLDISGLLPYDIGT